MRRVLVAREPAAEKTKTRPLASDRAFPNKRKGRSIYANVKGAQAIAEPGGYAPHHVAAVIEIAVANIAGSQIAGADEADAMPVVTMDRGPDEAGAQPRFLDGGT